MANKKLSDYRLSIWLIDYRGGSFNCRNTKLRLLLRNGRTVGTFTIFQGTHYNTKISKTLKLRKPENYHRHGPLRTRPWLVVTEKCSKSIVFSNIHHRKRYILYIIKPTEVTTGCSYCRINIAKRLYAPTMDSKSKDIKAWHRCTTNYRKSTFHTKHTAIWNA